MWPRDEDGNWDGGDGCSTVPSIVVELTWEELVYLESVAKNFWSKKAVVSSSLPYSFFIIIPGCYSRGDACGAASAPYPVHLRMAGVPVLAEEGRCARRSCCPGKSSRGRRTPSCQGSEPSAASPSVGQRLPPPSLWSEQNWYWSALRVLKSPTEISSSLFKSGSSSLKTEKGINMSWAIRSPCRCRMVQSLCRSLSKAGSQK